VEGTGISFKYGIRLKGLILGSAFILLFSALSSARNTVVTWALPADEPQSTDYQVLAGGKTAFVSTATVLRGEPASFSSFDFSGSVQVKISYSDTIRSFKILPASLGIQGKVVSGKLVFTLTQPANLTIEFNGSTEGALHLFANGLDLNAPSASDPNVIYFGPGVHEVAKLHPQSGQTIYLAPGAVVRAVIPDDEQPVEVVDNNGVQEKIYSPFIEAGGMTNITVSGHGILDLSGLPWHARKVMWFDSSSNILIEGITILDAPDWSVVLNQCTDVDIVNVKQISWRENGDGVDICNSQAVTVEDCFIRANDDCITVKTISPSPAMKAVNVLVQGNVLWNERARALGITSETMANILNVTFQDCDIIHDFSEGGDCSALAILVSDSGTMSNIVFRNIRVEDSKTKLIRCWIGADDWSQDDRRGHIKGVIFENISVTGTLPLSEFYGYDATHLIENVTINLVLNGTKIGKVSDANIATNEFVKDLRVVSSL